MNTFSYGNGISELYDVRHHTKKQLAKAIRNRGAGCRIMIASLTSRQNTSRRRLTSLGFKRFGKWSVNPNTGNKIALFVKKFDKKRKSTKK